MTREILHSDIIFARELLEARCEESGIVIRLCLRGIEPRNAKLLVESLRVGEPIAAQTAIAPCSARRHRSGYRRSHRHRRDRNPKKHWPLGLSAFPVQSHHPGHKRRRLRWYVDRAFAAGVAALGLVCLGYVLYEGYRAWPSEPDPEHSSWMNQLMLHNQGMPIPPSDNLKKLPASHL